MPFLSGLSLLSKIGMVLALVAALGAGYWVWHHKVYMNGWNDALASVAAQNAIAKKAADEVATKSDLCFDGGGTWNVAAGRCDK